MFGIAWLGGPVAGGQLPIFLWFRTINDPGRQDGGGAETGRELPTVLPGRRLRWM